MPLLIFATDSIKSTNISQYRDIMQT